MGMRDLTLLSIIKLFLKNEGIQAVSPLGTALTSQVTSKIYSLWWEYDDQTLEPIEPKLGPGEKLHNPVPHDEVIFWPKKLRWQV